MNQLLRHDTIAALATQPGRQGGIAIVRVSGSRAEEFLRALFVPAAPKKEFESHKMYYGHAVYGGETLDECMAVLFRAPKTYTREDVAEFQLHGGEYAANAVLRALYALGAVPAEAGEFTKRAFLNGRIDLSKAEAVMELISASGRQAARAALRQLDGGTSAFIKLAQDELCDMLSGVVAALDYPDEIDEAEAAADMEKRCTALAERLEKACDARTAHLLHDGLSVVLCGEPNVGKSSLLNALLMEERAIVTSVAGTTRDTVRGTMELGGLKVELYDTAGLRDTLEIVEKEGVRRAKQAMASADLLLMVLDASRETDEEEKALLREIALRPHALILNKTDISGNHEIDTSGHETIFVSAKTGEGLEKVRALIARYAAVPDTGALTQERHMQAAGSAAKALRRAAKDMQSGVPLDLVCVEMQEALRILGEVTGEQVDERLLDKVFSGFCVGK